MSPGGTDDPGFLAAYTEFRDHPFPGYPKSLKFIDAGFELLRLDTHIAGIAVSVFKGRTRARDVPELGDLAEDLARLDGLLDSVTVENDQDAVTVSEFRDYGRLLARLVRELRKAAAG
ncbi:hypothetical protein ACFVUY_09555 [Kitasatospora sp. NPDC058063]|uniref:hypothetical protein n=1 Tax=unclassified Kitasatospora TaxID=2633591 RepID=UPI0036DD8D99